MSAEVQINPGLKGLVGKRVAKEITFLESTVKVSKLSVAEALSIQSMASETANDGVGLILKVIRMSLHDADKLTDDDFKTFPMDDLTKLANDIMEYSGLKGTTGNVI